MSSNICEFLNIKSKQVTEMKINGKSYFGSSVIINGNSVVIDGNAVIQTEPNIKVEIIGECESVETSSGDVTIHGAAQRVKTMSGDVSCSSVYGPVSTMSGDVTCGDISDSVSTMSGDISSKHKEHSHD